MDRGAKGEQDARAKARLSLLRSDLRFLALKKTHQARVVLMRVVQKKRSI